MRSYISKLLVTVSALALVAGACSGGDEGQDEVGSDSSTTPTDPSGQTIESPDPRFVVDDQGRVLILRGVNSISSAKDDPEHTGGLDEAAIAPMADTFGFSAVRHLIFWEGVEPEEGRYDDAYLDRVEERLDWYQDHNIHVVLDMHQDIFSSEFGGNGAPAWAVETDGLTFAGGEDGMPWYLANADPAVQAATMNFFIPDRGYPELREAYVDAWKHVVDRFKDHPAVIGYDVMNEPSFNSLGTLAEALAWKSEAEVSGDWVNDVLTGFMQQAIDGIREVDPDGWVFVEPISVIGALEIPGDLGTLTDPRSGPPRLVYAPHAYPLELHDGGAYAPGWVGRFFDNRDGDQDRLGGIGLYIGEFGSGPPSPAADLSTYITELADRADAEMAGWAWWSWDPGGWGLLEELPDEEGAPVTLSDHAGDLVRPYPRAIAGVPTEFGYDRDANVFRLVFATRDGVTAPTEVVVPARSFPDGHVVVVTGGSAGAGNRAEVETSATESASGEITTVAVSTPGSDTPYEICVAATEDECLG